MTPFSGTCGAYIVPGVWKEFDCYNLAALGKTTNDNPFTPSWRLIGGYWQWGRKGPSSSQWYDTNTSNFAHGPTGPGSGDANKEAVNGWSSNNAAEDAWGNQSQAICYLLDQDADLFDKDPDGDDVVDLLADINTNGLRFAVNDGQVHSIEFDPGLLENDSILNHEDFVAALQPALAQKLLKKSYRRIRHYLWITH